MLFASIQEAFNIVVGTSGMCILSTESQQQPQSPWLLSTCQIEWKCLKFMFNLLVSGYNIWSQDPFLRNLSNTEDLFGVPSNEFQLKP